MNFAALAIGKLLHLRSQSTSVQSVPSASAPAPTSRAPWRNFSVNPSSASGSVRPVPEFDDDDVEEVDTKEIEQEEISEEEGEEEAGVDDSAISADDSAGGNQQITSSFAW